MGLKLRTLYFFATLMLLVGVIWPEKIRLRYDLPV